MGRYINIGNTNFIRALNGGFVDKSELIEKINQTLFTQHNMICVTRCRRFGKTTAANMLCAYYDKSCDSRTLFKGLAIEQKPSFEAHLNKYRVIFVTMTDIISKYGHNPKIVDFLKQELIEDLLEAYPDVKMRPTDDLMDLLYTIATTKGETFFMIIDEWDAICREFKDGREMDQYVELLRRLFKNQNTARVFSGAYITGIFPIKKYNTQSALNNFSEYTMLMPGMLAPYYGFTKAETIALCEKKGMDYGEMEKWYDGYQIGVEKSMFNPNSVRKAILNRTYGNYWTTTGAFDSVSHYIQMNFQGLKDDIIKMLAGDRVSVSYNRFNNDLKHIDNKDDVLLVLVHLGYLSYDPIQRKCFIPNLEVREEIEGAIEQTNWHEVMDAIDSSEILLKAAIHGEEEIVASGVEMVHMRVVNIQKYNTEESLSHVITMAFYTAIKDYNIQREMPAGKGFADLVFIPRKNVDSPVLVIELKYDKSVQTALDQIRERKYPEALLGFTNNIVLVGINYDLATKQHTCRIEKA